MTPTARSKSHHATTSLLTARRDHPSGSQQAHPAASIGGLVPTWASDPTIGYKTINARSETAATTPSFREPFKSHRCLIPADGFYEWQKNGKTKQPYCFEVNGGDLFAFAGLWDRWTSPQGEVIESCTILNDHSKFSPGRYSRPDAGHSQSVQLPTLAVPGHQ